MYNFADLEAAEKALEPFMPSRVARTAYTTDHVAGFMDFLGNPQDSIRAIHIAGTSGKTSTAHYTAALLQAEGQKVGLLTSPHVEKITERIRINLQPLSDRLFCDELALFLELVKQSGIQLTYAEVLYAMGYWEFARQNVSYIVIETGLGGLLDATNVINRADKVCIITDIGLDHTNVLGNTPAKIAAQKAGIIKRHNQVFMYHQSPEIMAAITSAAAKSQAGLHIAATRYSDRYAFLPLFQRRNFTLACEAVKYIAIRDGLPSLTDQQLRAAAGTSIPARMELIPVGEKTLILDGAHNTQKLQALHESITAQFPGQPMVLLASFITSGGRDLTALVQELGSFGGHIIFTVPPDPSHIWYGPSELAEAAEAAGLESFEIISDYSQAVEALLGRPEQLAIATGSLYAHAGLRTQVKNSSKHNGLG